MTLCELEKWLLDVVLANPGLIVLVDFNIHTEFSLPGLAHNVIASLTVLSLSQILMGPAHDERGHTLALGLRKQILFWGWRLSLNHGLTIVY